MRSVFFRLREMGVGGSRFARIASLLLVLFVLTAQSTAGALSAKQKSTYEEGSLFFDVEVGGNVAACGDSALVGSSNEAKVWNYLSGKNLTAIAVAGIMGNMKQEDATYDPALKQNYSLKAASSNPGVVGAALGIFQWDGARRVAVMHALDKAGLSKYYGAGFGNPSIDADPKNIPQSDMDKMLTTELDFAWISDTTKISSLAKQLNAAASVAGSNGSAELFNALFERSGDDPSQVQERVDSANALLKKYGGSSASGDTTDSGGCGALGGVSSLQDAIPWAQRFVADTIKKYHPSVTDLHQQKGSDIISLDRISHNSPVCWGGAADCGQCTAASGWFVTQLTSYGYGGGNGNEVVGNLKNLGVKTGSDPEPFSIFSTGSIGPHTGVVLGVLNGGEVITLENNWPGSDYPYGTVVVRQYNIKQAYPDVSFAYVGDKLKPGVGQ